MRRAHLRAAVIGALLLAPASLAAQSFSLFVSRVHASPDSVRAALVDSFLAAAPSFPLVEHDTTVHFLYTGSASAVTVPGDANGWDPDAFPMQRLSTTNLWYVTRSFEADARLDYKFVVNGTWMLDPRNPFTCSGGFGPNSELRMPRYPAQPELTENPGVPKGAVMDTVFRSFTLGNARTLRIYTPPGYETQETRYPVILVHDGIEYASIARMTTVMDNLIAQRRIQPLIAVFVPPVRRSSEYAGNQMARFSAFLVDSVLAWVDARFRTKAEPGSRAVMGASDGGNISLFMASAYPLVFGHVAAQSSNVVPSVMAAFRDGIRMPLRVYLDLGTYDIAMLIPLVRSFAAVLQNKGYEHRFREYHEGHSWGSWRARIDDILEYFFPAAPVRVPRTPKKSSGFLLGPNYPSPFSASTTIPLELSDAADVTLRITDTRGCEVFQRSWSRLAPGRHLPVWDASAAAPGAYLCEVTVGGASRVLPLSRM